MLGLRCGVRRWCVVATLAVAIATAASCGGEATPPDVTRCARAAEHVIELELGAGSHDARTAALEQHRGVLRQSMRDAVAACERGAMEGYAECALAARTRDAARACAGDEAGRN